MIHTVGIGEHVVSTQPGDRIVTHSLGSCIGLTLFDPEVPVGGMIHCMLPSSKLDPARAEQQPALFTDTGIALLLQEIFNAGGTRRRLVACAAGAASLLDPDGLFRIGERNQIVLRKMLWKNNILLKGEAVGGVESRTLRLDMDTGKTTVRTGGQEFEL